MEESYFAGRLTTLERKLDDLNENLFLLARIDERMLSHMEQQKRMSERQEKIERRLDRLELFQAKLLGGAAVISFIAATFGSFLSKIIWG